MAQINQSLTVNGAYNISNTNQTPAIPVSFYEHGSRAGAISSGRLGADPVNTLTQTLVAVSLADMSSGASVTSALGYTGEAAGMAFDTNLLGNTIHSFSVEITQAATITPNQEDTPLLNFVFSASQSNAGAAITGTKLYMANSTGALNYSAYSNYTTLPTSEDGIVYLFIQDCNEAAEQYTAGAMNIVITWKNL